MSAAAKSPKVGKSTRALVATERRAWAVWLPLLLALGCIASGVAVVEVKHDSRSYTARLNALRVQRDQLKMEWAQLRLEQATLDRHGRIQRLAQKQFGMIEPQHYAIVRQQAATGDLPSPTASAGQP